MILILSMGLGVALAAPGLRSEGVVVATNQGEGALYTTGSFSTSGGEPGLSYGLSGGFGLPQDVELELSLGMDGERAVNAELRALTPLLGRRDDPVLSLLAGLEATDAYGGFDHLDALSVELGLVASAGLVEGLRLYGGANANAHLSEAFDGDVPGSLTVEPAAGLCWRPALGKHLAGRVQLEAQGWTDLDAFRVGPALILGVSGR